jgi:hypothetical protein
MVALVMMMMVTVLILKCSVTTMTMAVATAHLMMTGAYGAELEQKFFTDAEKTNFKDALKYVTMLVWNGENIIQASPSFCVLVLNLVFVHLLLLHSCF